MQRVLLKIGSFVLELVPYIIMGAIQLLVERKDKVKQNELIMEAAREQATKTAQEAAISYYRGLK